MIEERSPCGATMLYYEQLPSEVLAPWVRSLWYCRAPKAVYGRERVLPNGWLQIILNLRGDALTDCGEDGRITERLPSAIIVGARARFEVIDTADLEELAGIIVRPGGFAGLFRERADLFFERSIALDSIWREPRFTDVLREAPTPAAKLEFWSHCWSDLFGTGYSVRNLSTMPSIYSNGGLLTSLLVRIRSESASGGFRRSFASRWVLAQRPGAASIAFRRRRGRSTRAWTCPGRSWPCAAATMISRTSPTTSAPSPGSTRRLILQIVGPGGITCLLFSVSSDFSKKARTREWHVDGHDKPCEELHIDCNSGAPVQKRIGHDRLAVRGVRL